MKNIRTIVSACLVVLSVVSTNPIKANASTKWIKDNTGWWYQMDSSWAVGWKLIDGKWYYFGQDGYMKSSCYIDGYYLGSDGAWAEPSAEEKTSDPNKVLSSGLTLFEAGQQIKALVNNLQSMGESVDSNMDYINKQCDKLGTTYEEISKLPVNVMNQTASNKQDVYQKIQSEAPARPGASVPSTNNGSYNFGTTGSNQGGTTVTESKPQQSTTTVKDKADGWGNRFGGQTSGIDFDPTGGTTGIDKEFDAMMQNANR